MATTPRASIPLGEHPGPTDEHVEQQWQHSRARLFAFLWACGLLIHVWNQGAGGFESGQALSSPWHWAVLLAAIAVLWRPGSAITLGVLCLAQLAALGAEFPLVANHWVLAGFANAGLLLALLGSVRRDVQDPVSAAVTAAAPYLRLAFLIAYVAAAIAKLNTGFLDPAHSCAVFLHGQMMGFFGLGEDPQGAAAHALVYGTAVVEMAIPFLLLSRRTRLPGLALAVAFHLLLAVTPVVAVMDFTAIVFALLVLFAPLDFADRLGSEWRDFARRRQRWLPRRVPPWLALLALGLVALVVGGRGALLGRTVLVFTTWAVFLTAAAAAAAIALAVLASYRRRPPPRSPRGWLGPLHWGHRLLVLALVANALSPYMGLKTTSSFTMFSNLRTEAGVTNHLLIPRLGPLGLQDDMVVVEGSSFDQVNELVEARQLVHHQEIWRGLLSDPDGWATYVRNGQRHTISGEEAAAHPDRPPWIQLKLLHFRHTYGEGDPQCTA